MEKEKSVNSPEKNFKKFKLATQALPLFLLKSLEFVVHKNIDKNAN
jgi:hypothetical protein